MAYALVGSLGAVVQSASGGAISGLAYGQSPTAGNLLVAWWASTGAATTPSTPAGWTAQTGSGGTSCQAKFFTKIAVGGDAVPAFGAVTSEVQSVMLGEFSGNAATTTVDQGKGVNGVTSPQTATMPAVDAAAGELVIYDAAIFHSATVTDVASGKVNGVSGNDTNNNATSTANHFNFGWGITTSNASPDQVAFTFSTTSLTGFAGICGSFKLAPVAQAIIPTAATASQATATVAAAAVATPTATTASQASATVTAPTTGPTVISAAAAQATAFVTATVGLDPAAVTATQATALVTAPSVVFVAPAASAISSATAIVFTITPALLVPVAASATLATTVVFNGIPPLGPRWPADSSGRWLQDVGVRWAPDVGVRWVPAGSTTYYGGAPVTTFATDLDGGGPATAFTTTIDGGVPF